MRSRATVVVDTGSDGRSRLRTVRSEAPLALRATPAALYLVGAAAAPLGGDDLRLDLDVGPGACLTVCSAAASLARPGSHGAWSRLAVTARVGAGAVLRWLVEPLVATERCRHRSDVAVEVAAGGRLVWREELVAGRHGEAPGDCRLALRADACGRPLLRHELAVGPHAPGWDSGAVLAGARVVSATLLVVPEWELEPPPARVTAGASLTPLPGPGALATALGDELAAVRSRVATLTDALPHHPPSPPPPSPPASPPPSPPPSPPGW